jgi:hypothetical protein
MNLEHAVQTITKRGFTDRQARFLVLVARHSGVCIMRQYSSFAGIVFGQKTRKFFAKLVRLGFVSTYDCAHNRGRVYHVRHRAIYEAIGEPDSRLRRPPGVPRALERLMLLDAILENPESIWMSSSAEKVAYLSSRGITADAAPHLVIRQGDQERVRYFPDRLPIGVHPSGHVVVVYLHADPMHDEFRDFLQRHASLLERLRAWTIRIVGGGASDGVRCREDRAARVAAWLQPSGADGRRRLKASCGRRFQSRKGTSSVTLCN